MVIMSRIFERQLSLRYRAVETAVRLRRTCDHFNTALTAIQRVENRLGTKKKPDGEAVELDIAKTLRKILGVLMGIYDVMRFTVHTHSFSIRLR